LLGLRRLIDVVAMFIELLQPANLLDRFALPAVPAIYELGFERSPISVRREVMSWISTIAISDWVAFSKLIAHLQAQSFWQLRVGVRSLPSISYVALLQRVLVEAGLVPASAWKQLRAWPVISEFSPTEMAEIFLEFARLGKAAEDMPVAQVRAVV